MRIFHELVYDGFIALNGFYYSNAIVNNRAGSVELINVSGYTTQVSGTTPTLTIEIEGGWDGQVYQGYGSVPIGGIALSTSGETLFQGVETSTAAKPRFARLKLSLGGASTKAYVRCGLRDGIGRGGQRVL